MLRPSASLAVALLGVSLMGLSGCNSSQPTTADETKKQLDQLVGTTRDIETAVKGLAGSSQTSADAVKALGAKLDAMQTALGAGLAKQKRGAIVLNLEAETSCDNDRDCAATARGVCNLINYPSATTIRFTPGVRPTLQSLVCFD